MSTRPSLGTLIFEEGGGPPLPQASDCVVNQNPAGGGIASVSVPRRAKAIAFTGRGTFVTLPNVLALVGTEQVYVKDGVTMTVLVAQASIDPPTFGYDPTLPGKVLVCICHFTLYPTA